MMRSHTKQAACYAIRKTRRSKQCIYCVPTMHARERWRRGKMPISGQRWFPCAPHAPPGAEISRNRNQQYRFRDTN